LQPFLPFLPHLFAMAALMVASGFFSCSEAALFYLSRDDRQRMATGTAGERAASLLLDRPDRLLTSILFWNLVINMAYFALASVITLGLERTGATRQATGLTLGALMAIIVFSEMLPKNFGVLWSRPLAALLGLPLSIATRLLDPLLPTLERASELCRRLLAPQFESEPYMELDDLERAIAISGSDPALVEQEQNILSRVVALSDTRVEEVMRPRRQYLAFAPPVTSDQLNGQTTPSGYLLVTERDSEEITTALPMEEAALLPPGERLDKHAGPVIVVPWCATAARTLTELGRRDCRVAAVLNELGETIGIVTVEDLMAQVLQPNPAPRHPHDRPGRLDELGQGVWQATGRTTLRRIAKQLGIEFPTTRAITVTGLLQEQLQRMPTTGDTIQWADHEWRAVDDSEESGLLVEFRAATTDSEPKPGEPKPEES